jgi:mono/diheme cytochrome c family protein
MSRKIVPALFLLSILFVALPLQAVDAAATFKAKCAACHGPDGAGDTTMGKKLGVRVLGSADVQKQTDDQLTAIISKGKGKMPPYGGKIADADIAALVKHIRTFAKK